MGKKKQPVTPREHYRTIVTAQNACLTSQELSDTTRHIRAESQLLRAMTKRKIADAKLQVQLNRKIK